MYQTVFFSAGKLERPSLEPAGGGTAEINRLYLSDKSTNFRYLIDTGADVSVIPRSAASKRSHPISLKLFAANGTAIATFGQQLISLDLGLRRVFKWPFITADVSQSIIGAHFLRHYVLLVDIRQGCLVDSVTNLQSQQRNNFTIKAVNGDTKFHKILTQFPVLTRAVSISKEVKHETYSTN